MNSSPQQQSPQLRGGGTRFLRTQEKPKKFTKTLLRLLGFFSGQQYVLILVIILSIGASAAALAGPFITGLVVDHLAEESLLQNLALIFIAMILLYIWDSVANFLQSWVVAGASQNLVYTLRKILFAHLQSLPIKFFDRHMHGELMSRLSNDTDNIAGILGTALVQLTSITITLIGVLAMMLWLSPVMTFFSLISVPLFFIVSKTIASKTRAHFRDQQIALGKLNAKIEEDITGMAVIKAYGCESRSVADFARTNEELRMASTGAQIWSGFIMPIMNVINNLSLAVIAFAGSWLAINGSITVGIIVAFIAYSRQFGRPLNELAGTYNQFQSALASSERIFEIMDEPEEESDLADAKVLTKARGDIKFYDVRFGYTVEKPIIEGCNFHAPPGSIIALVGPTGAGKTTIANLITRFYDVGAGEITLDGRPLNMYTRNSLRKTFGIVLQDTYLFTATLMDNLKYGNPEATHEEVIRAAKLVGAHHFISQLSGGYDTFLTENSRNLSQGQRQLLAITRCVLADPDILILDEATSSVDIHTEMRIQKAMVQLMHGRTSFVIAHRLNTIVNADQILVIDQGHIVEQGSHKELLKSGGVYSRMYKMQTMF